MLIENQEALKSWLAKTLSKLCDADPDALAKYILALVKKDKSPQALKTFLLEQLDIFLLTETKYFVELLFDALQKKSYLDTTSELGLSSTVGQSDSSLPTNSNLDVEDASQEDHRPSSADKIKSTNNSPDESQSKNISPQKRKNDDKHVQSKKVKTPNPYKEENYSTKTLEKDSSLPHGDTDYRQKKIGDSTTTKIQRESKIAYSTKQSTRCKDYDEKGYCLKGDFCDFDHGNDPILVEHGSALKFGVDLSSSDQFKDGTKPPLPPLPTSPPPPQPPPPPTDSFMPEPYNPESPGMNMSNLPSRGHNTHLNFYVPTVPLSSHIVLSSPQSLPPMAPKVSSGINSMMWGNAEPSFHHKPKQRARELIGVTTVDSASINLDKEQNKNINSDRTYLKPLNSGYFSSTARAQTTYQSDFKTKGFNYNRLGPSPRRKSLEIRKIPKSLNTITNLHDHFGKFGNIVNIEVGYAGDPEAAKISFSTHGEATAAYRSTEPIFNNRFIKVFWNNDFGKEMSTNFSEEIKGKESISSAETDNGAFLNSNPSESSKDRVTALEKVIEKPLVSKGNIPRSAYVSTPALSFNRKTNSFLATTRKGSEKEAFNAHKKKKYELHQAKSELIKSQIEHQKVILDQLIKAKNKKEKEFLKKTLLTISEQIKDLQNDLKKDNEELMNLLKFAPPDILKSTAKKELLDAELDLYNKQHAGADDTSELKQKVLELKTKAKALGLIGSSPPKPYFAKYAFKKPGNSRYPPTSTVSSLSVDHRPKKIFVLGSDDKDSLHTHFKQFGDIEKLDEVSSGIVFTFSSRMEAETAYVYGAKFGDKILTLSWFNDTDLEAIPQPDINKENPELQTIDTPSVDMDLDDEDDEEEEDSEARSWRH